MRGLTGTVPIKNELLNIYRPHDDVEYFAYLYPTIQRYSISLRPSLNGTEKYRAQPKTTRFSLIN